MNFLADESVDGQIVERLRLDGHYVLSIAEMAPGIVVPLINTIVGRIERGKYY